MGQGSEITAGPHRSLLRNDRQDAGVEMPQERLDHHRPDARMAQRQNVRAQQHDGPHDVVGKRVPRSYTVAADEIELESLEPVARNPDILQVSEARVDAVDLLAGFEDAADNGVRVVHLAERGLSQLDAASPPGHGGDRSEIETVSIENDGRQRR
jgi:hypothetical protein